MLRRTLPYHPFLIKPNLIELGEIFGRSLTDYDDIVGCAMHLQEEGARNVLVSMGRRRRYSCHREWSGILLSLATKADDLSQELVDVNGAGDAMVAGFLAGYLERHSMVDGFAKGWPQAPQRYTPQVLQTSSRSIWLHSASNALYCSFL